MKNTIKINRQKLYDEIWEISASGVAKQYGLNYAKLLQSCKEYEIPIPPSGYWTKIACGKEVSKAPLPQSDIDEIEVLKQGVSRKEKRQPEPTGKTVKESDEKSENNKSEKVKAEEWASDKADWFDPIVSREDEFFGKKEHDKADDDKNIFNKNREGY